MEIIKVAYPFLENVKEASIACIGYFDGLHKGHRALIEKTKELANKKDCKSACICFDKDPWEVIYQKENMEHLLPLEERLIAFEELGIDCCFLLHFDETMMNLRKDEFINDILYKLNLLGIVCGNDFHFAKKGEGNITSLQASSIETHIINEITQEGNKISSSTIETWIQEGNIEKANHVLYKPFELKGTIIHGRNVGESELGFPTANLKCKYHYVLPKNGVYAGYVYVLGKKYKAMINVGHNPTLNYQKNISIEAYLFDFHERIYDEEVVYSFTKYIREEKKFHSKEELIEQLHKDKKQIERL